MIFEENNPDVIENSENENCKKKKSQNDTGSSQNKLYNKYKTHSLNECAKNIIKNLWAIPKLPINDKNKNKTLNAQPDVGKFPHETHNTKTQNMCLCNQKYIWDSDEKDIIDWGSWEKCNHCKKQHEFCLNYNSENNFSLWADMMEKNLE